MDNKVALSPRAVEDLRDIVLYVSSDRPDAARFWHEARGVMASSEMR